MTGNVARKLGPEGGEAWVQADIVLPREQWDPLKDFEQRSGKCIPEGSSLESRSAQTLEER